MCLPKRPSPISNTDFIVLCAPFLFRIEKCHTKSEVKNPLPYCTYHSGNGVKCALRMQASALRLYKDKEPKSKSLSVQGIF